MKARIIGTDIYVNCQEVCWRGDQPGIKCLYLNGPHKNSTATLPPSALVEQELTDEELDSKNKEQINRAVTKFACLALNAIVCNPNYALDSDEEYAKKAVSMAKALYDELDLSGYTPIA